MSTDGDALLWLPLLSAIIKEGYAPIGGVFSFDFQV
jgi:hypothetical protein